MKLEKSCGAVIARHTENGAEILLIRHVNGGHWGFPKGHVENDETEAETALREIREETGLSVKLDTGFRTSVRFSPKPGVMKDVIYFAAEYDSGSEHKQLEEVADMRWVSLSDASNVLTYDNDRNVVAQYVAYMAEK